MEKRRKRILTFFKILFSILLIYFVFTKIQFKDVWEVLRDVRVLPLLAAVFLFAISKLIAAYRLNLYFRQLQVMLRDSSNIKLYLLGMFYNLFLPGGIGGDAYKGYLIKKHFEVRTRQVVAVLLLDRLSGLLLLLIYACLIGFVIKTEILTGRQWIFLAGILIPGFLFWYMNKMYFSYALPVFWPSLAYSAAVQLCQLGCVILLLLALDIQANWLPYLFIFLLSSVVAVLPLTIGGIGSREVVFFYGALWLGLEENASVSISMLFFFITALVSFAGIYYHFKPAKMQIV